MSAVRAGVRAYMESTLRHGKLNELQHILNQAEIGSFDTNKASLRISYGKSSGLDTGNKLSLGV